MGDRRRRDVEASPSAVPPANQPRPVPIIPILAVLVLVTGPVATPLAHAGPGARTAPTVTLEGTALELVPADPRAPALSMEDPGTARGLYAAALPDGGRLHLVWTQDRSIGVLSQGDEVSWVTVRDGQVVPLETMDPVPASLHGDQAWAPTQTPPGEDAPLDPSPTPSGAAGDGVLDIHLEGDAAYRYRWGGLWGHHQLRVAHLVDAILQANLDIELQVESQHAWRSFLAEPYQSNQLCEEPNLLREFRDHMETERTPTQEAPREVAHLFTGKPIEGSTIGCGYVREIETSWAYAVSEVARIPSSDDPLAAEQGSIYRDAILFAHELGHNMAGLHKYAEGVSCAASTIMWPVLCSNSPSYAGARTFDLEPHCEGACTFGNAGRMHAYTADRI